MRAIPYILYLLMIGFFVVIGRDLTSVLGVTINLAALLILNVALYKDELTAVWLGFLTGLVVAVGSPATMGWYCLIYAMLGFIGYHVRERLNLDSLYSKILLIFGGVFVVNIVLLPTYGTDAFFLRLWTVALSGAVYTSLVGLLFFLFKEGVITAKKIKSIF